MVYLILLALFAAVALGSVAVIADSAVRGRNAFRQLRGEPERIERDPRVTISFGDFAMRRESPAMRARSLGGSRPARRPAPSQAPSLPVAA